jgi:uncharacterized membrane protein
MKKAGIIALISLIVLAILVKSGMVDSLMLFVLGGIVPGTNFVVPSTFMLLLMASVAWLVVFSFVPSDIFSASAKKKSAKKSQSAKTRLPKQRFKQV